MRPDSSSERNPVEELAEEFAARHRRGERPSLTEYTQRYPQWADEIRDVFPALVMMEQFKPPVGEATAAGGLAPTADSKPLERLGDYRILREIGRGGMGLVYEAEQISLGRHVALKVLPTHHLLDPRHLARFRREAKAAARLHHTNIVPVYGVGDDSGLHYYVMQFIAGLGLDVVLEELKRFQSDAPGGVSPGRLERRTGGEGRGSRSEVSAADMARSLLTGGFVLAAEEEAAGPDAVPDATVDHVAGAVAGQAPPAAAPGAERRADTVSPASSLVVLPGSGAARRPRERTPTYWQSVARIGVRVADALEHAHRQGIQHRDIKPSNLLLDTQGTVWVTDFGLAKADDQQNLTHTGDILGTLRYMPPEAFEGRSDARSDVYSLGLTLYEMLAFRPAFDEQARNRLIKQVSQAEPTRLGKLNRQVPRDLETIVHKAMDRLPGQRYQTAAELAADLQRFLDDEPIRARRVGPWQRVLLWARRRPAAAGLLLVSTGALLAVAVAVVGLLLYAQTQTALQGEAEQRHQVEQYQYYHRVARAAAAWQEGSLAGVEELLDACPPEQRHWEWHFLKRQCHADLLSVAHDFDSYNTASFSPDGKWLLTVSRTVDIRDAATGVVVRHFPGDGVAAFSPDGRWLASSNRGGTVGRDKTVRLWDIATGQLIRSFPSHTDGISRLEFSHDGKRLAASGYGKGVVTVWDTTTAEAHSIKNPPDPARPRPPDEGAVNKAAFSSNGTQLALACRDSTAKICSATTGQVERLLRGHAWEVWDVAFSPDGKWLASASYDRTVKLWDVQTGQEVRTLPGHTSLVWGVAYSPDGTRLASASLDGTVRLWDAATGLPLRTYKGHTGGVGGVVFSSDSRRLASTSKDGTVKVWDATADPEATGFRVHTDVLRKLAYSPDGAQLASASHDGTVRLWDATTGRVIHTLRGPAGLALSVAFSSDGTRLASGHSDGTARIWDAATGREEHCLHMEPGSWVFVSLSQDGHRLATCGWKDPKVRVWDVATGQKIFELEGHGESGCVALAFSPDGSRLVTNCNDGWTIKVWDATTGAWLRDLTGHTWTVWSLAFNCDGTRLASASWDGTAKLWDMTTGQVLFTLRGHTFFVEGVAFTPDGKRLASVSREGTVKIWDTATGQEVFALRAETDECPYLTFSPDGHRLALSCRDGTVKIWDARPLADR
jgi:WD40 repeat protein/serine/threonine protein kinase